MAAMTGCTKMQDVRPVKNDLYGVWVYNNGALQFTIVNTDGRGDGGRFTDIKINGQRYLKVEVMDIKETYIINSVDDHNLNLTDSKNIKYLFVKYPLPNVN
jgi:hypothetical protein